MKAKKVCALLLASALAVGTVSALAACKKDDDENKGVVTDTRLWYVVGRNTKGTLSKYDNFYPQDTSVAFTRDVNVTEENVFTISLDIYADPAGYGFKFLYKTSADEVIDDTTLWGRQIGIENFADVEGEGEDAVIKNDKGETVFTTKGGMDAHNLYLAKGQEGTYEFTLKTKSDTDKDPVVTWKKTADIQVTHDMYIRGDVNNFGVNAIPMNEIITKVGETEVITWTAQVEVTAKDLWRDETGALKEDPDTYTAAGTLAALQIYNDIDKKTYAEITSDEVDLPVVTVESFDGDEYDCVLVPEGKYTITYHQADNKITYQTGTHEMYFRGSGEGMSWSDCLADFKLTDNDGYWTGTLTLKANDEVKVYNKLQTGDEAWYGYNGTGDNYKAETDGEYFFKFTEESGLLEVEKVEYWLIGTFLDAEDEKVDFEIKSGVTPKGEVADGVVTWEIEVKDVTTQYDWLTHADWCDNTENVVMCVKIVCSTELIGKDGQNAAGKTGNLYINEGAGTYTVTYDIENGTYQITKKAA